MRECGVQLEGHRTMMKLLPPMFEVGLAMLKEKMAKFVGGVSCAIDL